MKRHNAGFTLIEILVVLVIITILVSMATINTSHDGRYDELKDESERLKFIFTAGADEALFQNKNLGLRFTQTGFKPYFWEEDYTAVAQNADASSVQKPKIWKLYSSRHLNSYQLPEDYTFELKIEGQQVTLPYAFEDDDKKVEPNVFLFASGEQTPFTLTISVKDFSGRASIRGDGLGRYYSEVIRDEE